MRRKTCRKSRSKSWLLLFTILFWGLSGLTCIAMLNKGIMESEMDMGREVGKQYLAAAFPAVSRSSDSIRKSPNSTPEGESLIIGGKESPDSETAYNDDTATFTMGGDILDSVSGEGDPSVLIYHTHATESYQPVSTGNFHSMEEEGTVREVGSVLKKALEARGISVIHDKAIHDSPSYSKSYSRSLESAQKMIEAYPSIKMIIDLHRDAASYTGNTKHTFMAQGKQSAQFCLVVGEGNANAEALKSFANRINQKANSLYPGFSKGTILKEYKYNQYISDNYILLEMGNNQNSIEEAKDAAIIFAHVIAEVLKEMH